jgi:hypothetical protein
MYMGLASPSATFHKNSIYVFGGYCQVKPEPHRAKKKVFFNDLYKYDVLRDFWSTVKQQGEIPEPRAYHTATLISDDRILLIGGYPSETSHVLHIKEDFTWRPKRYISLPVQSHSADLVGSIVWIFGGEVRRFL